MTQRKAPICYTDFSPISSFEQIKPIMEKFIDVAKVYVRAGKGGDGVVSFRREKFQPKGGPDGGDGGKGGDVIFRASSQKYTLLDFKYKKHLIAQDGENGKPKNQKGKDGEDLIVLVPVGTVIKDEQTGEILADLDEDGKIFVAAKGGRGGRGNSSFRSSTFQMVKIAEKGTSGEERWVILELKFIADVGIIGLPNAGKSTLLKALTRANPKIAPYPFTTISPNLGVMDLDGQRRLYIVDIPGLIEGASEGKGLGNEFLRHIERARIYVHLIDITGDPKKDFQIIMKELENYNPELLKRKMIVVLNKLDLLDSKKPENQIRKWKNYFEKLGYLTCAISALTGYGINELKETLWSEFQKAK